MFKWRIVLFTKSGRKFIRYGVSQSDYEMIKNQIDNVFSNEDNGYVSFFSSWFRIQLKISEIDCIIYRKTILGW